MKAHRVPPTPAPPPPPTYVLELSEQEMRDLRRWAAGPFATSESLQRPEFDDMKARIAHTVWEALWDVDREHGQWAVGSIDFGSRTKFT